MSNSGNIGEKILIEEKEEMVVRKKKMTKMRNQKLGINQLMVPRI